MFLWHILLDNFVFFLLVVMIVVLHHHLGTLLLTRSTGIKPLLCFLSLCVCFPYFHFNWHVTYISPCFSVLLTASFPCSSHPNFIARVSLHWSFWGSWECWIVSVGQMDPTGLMSYKDALTELVSSLEAMNVNHEPVFFTSICCSSSTFDGNLPWLDVNFSNNNGYDDQQQFLLSPSTPLPSPISNSRSKFYAREFPSPSPISTSRLSFVEEPNNNNNNNSATNKYYSDNGLGGGPDLGWVNDLLTWKKSYGDYGPLIWSLICGPVRLIMMKNYSRFEEDFCIYKFKKYCLFC